MTPRGFNKGEEKQKTENDKKRIMCHKDHPGDKKEVDDNDWIWDAALLRLPFPRLWTADDSSKNSRCNGRSRGPSFAADQDEGPQRGSGRPIPPLVSKIQVATTNAGARAEGGLTPDFL